MLSVRRAGSGANHDAASAINFDHLRIVGADEREEFGCVRIRIRDNGNLHSKERTTFLSGSACATRQTTPDAVEFVGPHLVWFNDFRILNCGRSGGLSMYRMMVADYDSPSYFVATAAAKPGF